MAIEFSSVTLISKGEGISLKELAGKSDSYHNY